MAEGSARTPRQRARSGRGSDDSGDDGAGRDGEFESADEVHTAIIGGNTFDNKAVQYVVIDGLAIFEGDIVLGTVEEVERETARRRGELPEPASVVISGNQFRWPNCRVPFTIDPALPSQNRVTDAIAHWEANTRFRFVGRTTETNFVTFRPGSGCSASVGMRGGQQFVNLAPGCTTGSTIHEIGHVVGLWHEQSREDRDTFVRINWPKIEPGREHNFNQHITDGDDVGAYDYASIMHYPRTAFSIDGSETITPVTAGVVIGQRTGLSAGDIASANAMCPKVIKEAPKDPIKDGRFDTRKELVKDIRFDTRKEIIVDTRKEQIKDRIKDVALDPPFKRIGSDQILPVLPGRPPIVRPGGALPFAVATPHAAPSAQDADELATAAADLDAQMSAIAEEIAQAEAARDALQAQYDEMAALLDESVRAHDEQA